MVSWDRQKLRCDSIASIASRNAATHAPRPALLLAVWFATTMLACGNDAAPSDGFDPTKLYRSEAGLYQLQAARNPDPPQKGLNSLDMTLTDMDGHAVPGASIQVEPWMPAHGHGTTVVETVDHEDGEYSTDELYFNMAGRWEIRVTIDGPEGNDRVVLSFEVYM